MNEFSKHWDLVLNGDHKNQVDILASIHEDGINHFLKRSWEIDQVLPANLRKFKQTFTRIFHTTDDQRKFTITLEISKPLRIDFIPFNSKLDELYRDTTGWSTFDYPSDGPELTGMTTSGDNLFRIIAPELDIHLKWPNLDTTKPDHEWKIPTVQVLGQAEIQLNQEGNDFYTTIIPKFIKLDLDRPKKTLKTTIEEKLLVLPPEGISILDDCETKFVDLFIIAANIAAYEQTPKLVTSINIPVPSIQDRPLQPAAFDISHNIMTVGFGIDKVKLEEFNEARLSKAASTIDLLYQQDVEKAGGEFAITYKDYEADSKRGIKGLKQRSKSDSDEKFEHLNDFIKQQKNNIKAIRTQFPSVKVKKDEIFNDKETFAIGINEYFFDMIADSAIPSPQRKCTEEERVLRLVKGNVCYWTSFRNPDIDITTTPALNGAVDINIGGSIRACVKRFWDCSWRWACGSLALAIVGRPKVKIRILKANGVKVLGSFDKGNLRIESNLPSPFNDVIKAFSRPIMKVIEAFANFLAVLLSFHVLKPEFVVEPLSLKLLLKNFSSFYFERKSTPSSEVRKNKFIGFKTNLAIIKFIPK